MLEGYARDLERRALVRRKLVVSALRSGLLVPLSADCDVRTLTAGTSSFGSRRSLPSAAKVPPTICASA